MDQSQNSVFQFFEEMGADPSRQSGFERINTHANVIFLIGELAYKIKRAVRYPFLDYSTLALREEACKAEITFNRPKRAWDLPGSPSRHPGNRRSACT